MPCRGDDDRVTVTPRIVRAPHPPSLDHPDAWAYKGRAAVDSAADIARLGYDDLAYRAHEILAIQADQTYTRRGILVALAESADENAPRPEDVIGYASYLLPLTDRTHVLRGTVKVHPAHDDNTVHDALLGAFEQTAVDARRRTVAMDTEHSPEPPPGPGALTAPTGSGRVPTGDSGVSAILRAGFTLGQVERYSVLPLPVDTELLGSLSSEATAHAGTDYRLHLWHDDVPEQWLPQVAYLQQRMSTDAPHGELEAAEEIWDAERYRSVLDVQRARGLEFQMAVAEHVGSGTLAGFTVLTGPAGGTHAFQEDTLVLTEHRGRRLGMLMKTVNLRELQTRRPEVARIHTWNAEENDPMLAINEALGFRGAGVCAQWEKPLDAEAPTT